VAGDVADCANGKGVAGHPALTNRRWMPRAAYEIRVLGEIPPRVLDDYERVTSSVDPLETTLRAESVDEAELQGILEAIRRCDLVLVDVRRLEEFD
jgi:hypothetical protein